MPSSSWRAAGGTSCTPPALALLYVVEEFGLDNLRRLRELMDRPPTLEDLLDGAAISILCADDRGLIVTINRRAEALLGYLDSEMQGHPLTDVITNHVELTAPRENIPVVLKTKLAGDLKGRATVSFVTLAPGQRLWVVQVIALEIPHAGG